MPYLLSGCSAQVQPRTAGLDESRLNGINSSAWSNPVIGHTEGNPQSSRIMRLFSNSRKGPIPAYGLTADGCASTQNNNSNSIPQSWSGLSGLGVVDSFKKLRSSVLQSIQSRESTDQEGEHALPLRQEMTNGTVVANTDPGIDGVTNHLNSAAAHCVSNGNPTIQKMAMMHQYNSDIEDYDDEDEEGGGLARNTRFSRSIRRAYGAGRISLHDTGNRRAAKIHTNESTDTPSSKVCSRSENMNERPNVKVLNRLSKSAENLHIFKAPFRRKALSPRPSSTQEHPQRTTTSNIQRTPSASSVDLQIHATEGKTPVKTKAPMLKLVGSMTDLTVRRKQSPSNSPTSPSPMSPLSRLHDDYSRRVPCLQTSERQRRPSPVRARFMSLEHPPLFDHQPDFHVNPQQHQVLISPVYVNPLDRTEQTSTGISAHFMSQDVVTASGKQTTECATSLLNQKEAVQHPEYTEVFSPTREVRELANSAHNDERSLM